MYLNKWRYCKNRHKCETYLDICTTLASLANASVYLTNLTQAVESMMRKRAYSVYRWLQRSKNVCNCMERINVYSYNFNFSITVGFLYFDIKTVTCTLNLIQGKTTTVADSAYIFIAKPRLSNTVNIGSWQLAWTPHVARVESDDHPACSWPFGEQDSSCTLRTHTHTLVVSGIPVGQHIISKEIVATISVYNCAPYWASCMWDITHIQGGHRHGHVSSPPRVLALHIRWTVHNIL